MKHNLKMMKVQQQNVKKKENSLLGLEFTSDSSEIHRLWERSNGGGRKIWQVQLLLLSIQPSTDICGSAMVRTLQSSSLNKKE